MIDAKAYVQSLELTTLDTPDNWSRSRDQTLFVADVKAVVRYSCSGAVYILDARNSLKTGRTCPHYTIRSLTGDPCGVPDDCLSKFGYSLSGVLHWLQSLALTAPYTAIDLDRIRVTYSEEPAKEIVTPWGLYARILAGIPKQTIFRNVSGVPTGISPDQFVAFYGAGDTGEDRIFHLGEVVQVDSHHLHYYGIITSIKPTYIETYGCPNGLKRNTYEDILRRNRSVVALDAASRADANRLD